MKKEEIEECMLAGRDAVALTLDTTVYDRFSHRLDHGVLKRLEQFRQSGTFLLSEVVLGELRSHMLERTRATREAIQAAVNASANYWATTPAQRSAGIQELTGDNEAAEILVDKRIEDFIERCAAVPVPANLAPMEKLVQRYFKVEPPFENRSKKKNEFPDAIALLSLEVWAAINGLPVIVVSGDDGWRQYAQASSHLCWMPELSDALEIYQRLDERRLELVTRLAIHVDRAGPDWEGFEQIKSDLAGVDWEASAYSGFDFDVQLEVEVQSVSLDGETAAECLSLIDYDGVLLSVAAKLRANVKADAQFSFSMEEVRMGGCELSSVQSIPFEAVLSFSLYKNGPVLQEVEIDRVHRRIEFADVEPDHSLDVHDYDG